MNKPRPILLAVRLALYGTAIATTPALIATGVGIAHGRIAEPIAQCRQGQEVAVCAEHPVADERELHRERFVLPESLHTAPIRQLFASPSSDDYAAEEVMTSILASQRGQSYNQLLMPAWRGSQLQGATPP